MCSRDLGNYLNSMNEMFQRFNAVAPAHRQSQTVAMWVGLNNVLECFPLLLIGETIAIAVVTGFFFYFFSGSFEHGFALFGLASDLVCLFIAIYYTSNKKMTY